MDASLNLTLSVSFPLCFLVWKPKDNTKNIHKLFAIFAAMIISGYHLHGYTNTAPVRVCLMFSRELPRLVLTWRYFGFFEGNQEKNYINGKKKKTLSRPWRKTHNTLVNWNRNFWSWTWRTHSEHIIVHVLIMAFVTNVNSEPHIVYEDAFKCHWYVNNHSVAIIQIWRALRSLNDSFEW